MMDKMLNGLLFGVALGLLWGFNLFYRMPDEAVSLKKQGAISVYEGHTKCEKALDTWVCKTQKGGI